MNTDEAKKVKVVADHDKNGYLTVGKTYNISRNDGEYFWINKSDIDFGVYCMWKGCFHGYEYEPVFESQENHWHYQLMKHVEGDGEEWYGIHEYHPLEGSYAWTGFPITVEGACIADVKWQLENMLKDIDKHGVKDY